MKVKRTMTTNLAPKTVVEVSKHKDCWLLLPHRPCKNGHYVVLLHLSEGRASAPLWGALEGSERSWSVGLGPCADTRAVSEVTNQRQWCWCRCMFMAGDYAKEVARKVDFLSFHISLQRLWLGKCLVYCYGRSCESILYPLTQWVTAWSVPVFARPAALVATPQTRSRTRTIWLVASKEYLKAPSSALSPLSHKP